MKFPWLHHLFAVVLAAPSIPAVAQEHCNSILSLASKNIYKAVGAQSSERSKYASYCGTDSSSWSESTKASFKVNIIGSGDGGAEFDQSKTEAKRKEWCNVNKEYAKDDKSSNVEAEVINNESVAAWQACKALNAEGFRIESQITDDVVDLKLRYPGDTASGVQFFSVAATNFACDTIVPGPNGPISLKPDQKVDRNVLIGSQAISVLCKREGTATRTRPGDPTEYRVRPRASITVRTASRTPFTLPFVEEWTPDVPGRQSTLIREELAKANGVLAAQVKDLQTAVAQLKAETSALPGIKAEVAALTASASAEKSALRLTFNRQGVACSPGWVNRNPILIPMQADTFPANNLGKPGAASQRLVFEGWQYTVANLCERG